MQSSSKKEPGNLGRTGTTGASRKASVNLSSTKLRSCLATGVNKLKYSEEYFRSLMECAHDMISVHDENTIIQYVTPSVEKIIGYKPGELVSSNPFDLVHPDDVCRLKDSLAESLLNPGKSISFEGRVRHKDGSWVYIDGSGKNLLNLPSVRGIVVNCCDVTERKLAEKALRESEEIYRSLTNDVLDNVAAGILIVDSSYKVVWINQAMEQYFDVRREDVVGKDKRQLIRKQIKHIFEDPETFERKVLATYKNNTYAECFECHVLPKGNRKERWLEHWSEPIASGLYVGGRIEHHYDITQRKLVEQALLEQRAELKSLASELSLAEERERRRIAVDLHDQIGQSLVFSKIKLKQLGQKVSENGIKKALDDICRMISEAIVRTRTLTFDLSSPILYELGFKEAVAELLQEQVENKHGIQVDFTDDGAPKSLDDDVRVLLFRDVRELLINVVKHAEAKNVCVSLRQVDSEIEIVVEDDGIGFVVSEDVMSARAGAFGLFSIRERLERCGGRIEIDSEPGKGTSVTIRAPLKRDGDKRILS